MHRAAPLLFAVVFLAACGSPERGEPSTAGPIGDIDGTKAEPGKEDSSVEAVFLDFTFEAEMLTDRRWMIDQQVESQLLYTIGQLNGDRSVGRLDQLELTDVQTTEVDGDYVIHYTAKIPVAWGKKDNIPPTYTFKLPRDTREAALEEFTTKHSHTCVDWGAHDVDSGSMWYYYRPARSGCRLSADEIFEAKATIAPSASQTTGKFPEYDRIWADGELRVLAVFGQYEAGDNASDAGVRGYNKFVAHLPTLLGAEVEKVVTLPESVPSSAGPALKDVNFDITMTDGRRIVVDALLVENVRTASEEFYARYEAESGRADLIVYNGHAGLGSNIRALARRGKWQPEQYAVVFMNGCDTYAYVDSALWDAHADVNDDDPIGTKYLDLVTNAMPSYFASMTNATEALVTGLAARDNPLTYEQIFAKIDSSQVVLVSGEEDNTFAPGEPVIDPPSDDWTGLSAEGTLARDEAHPYETPALTPGKYVFELHGTGDADLYVRIGEAPTVSTYDCRPYKSGSNETCVVEVPDARPVHAVVRGYAADSTYTLEARRSE